MSERNEALQQKNDELCLDLDGMRYDLDQLGEYREEVNTLREEKGQWMVEKRRIEMDNEQLYSKNEAMGKELADWRNKYTEVSVSLDDIRKLHQMDKDQTANLVNEKNAVIAENLQKINEQCTRIQALESELTTAQQQVTTLRDSNAVHDQHTREKEIQSQQDLQRVGTRGALLLQAVRDLLDGRLQGVSGLSIPLRYPLRSMFIFKEKMVVIIIIIIIIN